MAPKSEGRRGESKAEWKAVGGTDGEAKGGSGGGNRRDKGSGKGNRDEGEDDGARRQKAQGKGGRKGKDGGGSGWDQSGGWSQSGSKRSGGTYRGGYGDEEQFEGGYGFSGSGGYAAAGYGFAPWQDQEGWQPMPPDSAPEPAKSPWTTYTSPDGAPYYYNSKTGLTQWERPAEMDPPPPPVKPPAEMDKFDGDAGKGRARQEDGDDRRRSGGEGKGRGGDRRGDGEGGRGRGRKKEAGGANPRDKGNKQEPSEFGPPGCNLFVFHLPDDWADDDLHEYFAPHGNVVSAKVMKELGTGRSRGFGFVSYEDRVGAATAIKKMQGYKILGKRLKVEFKKGEGEHALEDPDAGAEADEASSAKKSYPDDERLIGYLRAISAKNVVQSLKENEGADDGDAELPETGAYGGTDEVEDDRDM